MSFTTIILAAAKTAGVSGSLLLAICTHESGLKNTLVQNDKGSPTFGICQIKAPAAAQVGFIGNPLALMVPEVNAKYAARYLRYQLNRYDQDSCMAVAAYNMGSYRESKKHPGQPTNISYIAEVATKSNENLFGAFNCRNNQVAEQ